VADGETVMVREGICSNVVGDVSSKMETSFFSNHTVGVCHDKPLYSKHETPFIANYTVGAYCNTPLHNPATTFIPNHTIFFVGTPL
jgi:hypothetical protein